MIVQGAALYLPGMSARVLDRIFMVLAFVGLGVAGLLSYGSIMNLIPPCGGSGGCALVQTSQYAYVFGIPVAHFGTLGFLVLAGLAVLRSGATGEQHKKLASISLVITILGTLVSFGLTYISLTQIQATCFWCLISAGLWVVLFILNALISGKDAPEDESAKGIDMTGLGIGAVAALGVFGVTVSQMTQNLGRPLEVKFDSVERGQVVPDNSRLNGDGGADVVVVEWADVNCPACRTLHGDVKSLVSSYGGKVTYGFRHLPLTNLAGHETSTLAAVISLVAAEEGKFFDYLDAAFAEQNQQRVKSRDGLIAIATEIGLDRSELTDTLENDSDPYIDTIAKDIAIASTIGVSSTPTFVVWPKSGKPTAVTFQGLKPLLDSLTK